MPLMSLFSSPGPRSRRLPLLPAGAVIALAFASLSARSAAPAAAPRAASEELIITARGGFEFFEQSGEFRFWDHVEVIDPGTMILSCDHLTGRRSAETERIDSVIATTNVVLTTVEGGVTNRAVAGMAVYSAVQDSVVLTGDPRVQRPEGELTGQRIVFERSSKKLRAEGGIRMKFKAGSLRKEPPATKAASP